MEEFCKFLFLPSLPAYIDVLSFYKVKHFLTEHYKDTTPFEGYVRFINADTCWADDWFILEMVLDGGVFLSPHFTDLPCESYCWGYNSMIKHLHDEYIYSLVFVNRS